MNNLVGRKVKAIRECVMHNSKMNALKIGKEYEIKIQSGYHFAINSEISKRHYFDIKELEQFFELVVDEWVPKQGERIFAGKDESNFIECIYVATYNGVYYTTSGVYRYIEPFKEEIKVGDWCKVLNEDAVIKMSEKGLPYSDCYEKITDKELIKKLEEL